jgi:hypothetical protein
MAVIHQMNLCHQATYSTTLIVLLGMSRLGETPDDVNVSEIFRRNVAQLTRLAVARYCIIAGPDCISDTPSGLRRRFASFATQTYLMIACFR